MFLFLSFVLFTEWMFVGLNTDNKEKNRHLLCFKKLKFNLES